MYNSNDGTVHCTIIIFFPNDASIKLAIALRMGPFQSWRLFTFITIISGSVRGTRESAETNSIDIRAAIHQKLSNCRKSKTPKSSVVREDIELVVETKTDGTGVSKLEINNQKEICDNE